MSILYENKNLFKGLFRDNPEVMRKFIMSALFAHDFGDGTYIYVEKFGSEYPEAEYIREDIGYDFTTSDRNSNYGIIVRGKMYDNYYKDSNVWIQYVNDSFYAFNLIVYLTTLFDYKLEHNYDIGRHKIIVICDEDVNMNSMIWTRDGNNSKASDMLHLVKTHKPSVRKSYYTGITSITPIDDDCIVNDNVNIQLFNLSQVDDTIDAGNMIKQWLRLFKCETKEECLALKGIDSNLDKAIDYVVNYESIDKETQ